MGLRGPSLIPCLWDCEKKCGHWTKDTTLKWPITTILHILAGGGKCLKWKLSFGGFCGDNMGKKGPKTLNIW